MWVIVSRFRDLYYIINLRTRRQEEKIIDLSEFKQLPDRIIWGVFDSFSGNMGGRGQWAALGQYESILDILLFLDLTF